MSRNDAKSDLARRERILQGDRERREAKRARQAEAAERAVQVTVAAGEDQPGGEAA
jgi:hypothetical protein